MHDSKNKVSTLCSPSNPEAAGLTFETSDLKLASFLVCRNFYLAGFRCSDGKPVFIFVDSSALRYAVVDYSEDGVVPVRTFCNTLRNLQDVCC